MGDFNFNKEERDLIAAFSRDRRSMWSRLGYYASFLAPFILFSIYGFLKQYFAAVSVALGLLIFVWWRLSGEFSKAKVYQSFFQKLSSHGQASTGIAQPGVAPDLTATASHRQPGE